MTRAAADLLDTDPTVSPASSPDGSDTSMQGGSSDCSSSVDMLARLPTPSSGPETPAATDDDEMTTTTTDSEVQTPDVEPVLEWQIPLPSIPVGGPVPGTHHERIGDHTPDTWSAATQKPGWELEWDVSEFTLCQPTAFLEPLLGGVHDAEWAVVAEQEALMRIGPVGEAAAGFPGVSDHVLLANAAHPLAPVVLEHWEPLPAPFAEAIGTAPDDAYLPGSKRLVVWMESDVVAAGQIKPGMGAVFELKWLRRQDRTFWFVEKVHVCISNVSPLWRLCSNPLPHLG
jgi:hypothetical protein